MPYCPGIVFTVLAIATLGAHPSQANETLAEREPYPVHLVGVLRGENQLPAKLTLVGKSGQLYLPRPLHNTWRRAHAGGIASDVIGAVRAGPYIYAISQRAPIHRLHAGVWNATQIIRRGSAAFARGGALPLAALDRHIYWIEGQQWKRAYSAAHPVTALWAHSKKRIYFATTRGQIHRLDNHQLFVVKNDLPANDYLVRLGGEANHLYGLSKAGRLLHMDHLQASRITLSPEFLPLQIHCLGVGLNNQTLAAGFIVAQDGSTNSVLIRLSGSSPKLLNTLWPLKKGDRFAFIHSAGKALMVASESGTVAVKETPSSRWRKQQISGLPPVEAVAKTANSATKSPARAR